MGIIKKLIAKGFFDHPKKKKNERTKVPYIHLPTTRQQIMKVLRHVSKHKDVTVIPLLDLADRNNLETNPFNSLFKKRNRRVKLIWLSKEADFRSRNGHDFYINYSVLFKTSHKQIKDFGKMISDALNREGLKADCRDYLSGRLLIRNEGGSDSTRRQR